MSNYFQIIKKDLNNLPKKKIDKKEDDFVRHYLGTKKKLLCVKTADVLSVAKKIAKSQNDIPTREIVSLLTQLFSSEIFEEHIIGGKIFTLLTPDNRAKIPFSQLEEWLAQTNGWAELDVICQSSFTAPEVLERWPQWQKNIQKFSQSSNIQIRRASLVLQNLSVRKTKNDKLEQLALDTIETLKHEKEVLITKAISWLLRCLISQDKEQVRKYILQNESTLPRIAFRETMKKIETGKK